MHLDDELIRHLLAACDHTTEQELSCADLLPYFARHLDGGFIDPCDQPQDLRAHLNLCAACRQEWATLVAIARP